MGSALLPELVARGHDVRVLDDFSLSSPRNLTAVSTDDYEFVRGSVRDSDAVERAVEGVDAVVHLAAITGAATSHEIPGEVHDVNVEGTKTVVDAAVDAGVDRVILASSCNIYGGAYDRDIVEDDELAPPNPYAESKVAAEEYCRSADVDAVSIRLATNFGWSPGVRFNLVVNTFTFRALAGEPLTVYGDGTNWRPFVHVRDAARAYAEALDWDPGAYNVGLDNFRVEEVASAVEDTVGESVDVTYLRDEDPGPSYHVDFAKVREQGFEPEYSLVEGIEELATRFTDGPGPFDSN